MRAEQGGTEQSKQRMKRWFLGYKYAKIVPCKKIIRGTIMEEQFMPLINKIDDLLQEGRAIVAIEGGSASGKTTLSKILEEIYGATVFCMDDFFLQAHQRTPERFATPGGNVDWERFLEEVLVPLKREEQITYRPFDCSIFELGNPITVNPSKLVIVEGAYCMHEKLAEYYDLSVFLDITETLQKERINKRNSPAMAERFFKEWIPMERLYFDKMCAKKRCDMTIEVK